MFQSFHAAVAEARRHGDLYFAALLSQDRIEKAFGTARWLWQGWIYTPAVTVWVFLSQCLSADHSCRDAVARLIAWRVARGLKPCSAETGAYCTARNDLPEEVLHELMRGTGKQIEDESPTTWLWLGRKVRAVDGSTITMPDTPENQAAYPQQKAAKARLRLSHCPNPGHLFALGGDCIGGGDRQVQGQADRRKQLVSRTLLFVGRRRRGPGRPLFQRLVRSCLAAATRHRRGDSQTPTPANGLSHGHAIGQRRSLGFVGTTATTEMDDGRAVRHTTRRVDFARDPHLRRSEGNAYSIARRGDNAARSPGVSARGYCFVVPASLASGASFAKSQNNPANGPLALQDSRTSSQGVLHASAGLQFDSRSDGRGRLPVRPISMGNQLQGHTSNAQPVSSRSLWQLRRPKRGARHCWWPSLRMRSAIGPIASNRDE